MTRDIYKALMVAVTMCEIPIGTKVRLKDDYPGITHIIDGYQLTAQRTGCSMCGFGIHMEKRPHRFDLLYESNPKEWDYLMFHMCKDAEGNDYGWAKVLEYIGVGWDPSTIGGNCKGQMSLDDFLKE